MSKLFFDNIIEFREIEIAIKNNSSSIEEREELGRLVESIVNGKVLEKVLDKLPEKHHEEFLMLFHTCPHDEVAIFQYLRSKTNNNDIEEDLGKELKGISAEILKEFKILDEISMENNVSNK